MSLPDVPAPTGTSSPLVAPAVSTTSTAPGKAAAPVRRWPVALLVVFGAACLIAAVPLFRHGVVAHAFPSYVRDAPSYAVQRWSAPWIGGALAVGGLGLVCWAVAGGLLTRARRRPVVVGPVVSRPVVADRTTPVGGIAPDPSGLAPRPTEAAREY